MQPYPWVHKHIGMPLAHRHHSSVTDDQLTLGSLGTDLYANPPSNSSLNTTNPFLQQRNNLIRLLTRNPMTTSKLLNTTVFEMLLKPRFLKSRMTDIIVLGCDQ